MVYDSIIKGKFVTLRSINPDDAEFSYNIRADKKNRDTVGQLASSIEAQRDYIINQMKKPGDYYFVVLNNNNERIGLIGVYDIHGEMGEIGREVNVGEPMETLEASLLINDFCRNVLKLKKLCYVIYSNNKKNISNVKKRGGNFIGYVERSGVKALYYEDELSNTIESENKIRKMLERLANRDEHKG